MPDYFLGLLTIPALAVVCALAFLAVHGIFWVRDEFLTHNPRYGRRVYAYRVTATTGNTDLIGAVFTERRNLGKKHAYLISWDGTRYVTAWAERLPGGGRYRDGHVVDWDDETIETMDDYVRWRDSRPKAPAAAAK